MRDQIIRADHPALRWDGAIEVEHTTQWSRPWRLPYSRLGMFPDDGLRFRAAMPAGVRIAFRTDSTRLEGRIAPSDTLEEESSPIDLVIDGDEVRYGSIVDGGFRFADLPAGEKQVELWLPQFGDIRLEHLILDAEASVVETSSGDRARLITYGSSITQCRTAASPTRTWPAIVARDIDADLTCLGFGGQAHLDPMIARMIRDLPADMITACLGINVYGAGTFNARSFLPAVLGFLATIRDGHPATPILVISPIYSSGREDSPGTGGMTLRDIRADVREAVDLLRKDGDTAIHLQDGLDVLDADQHDRLGDGLHPDAAGYELMASRIGPVVSTLVGSGPTR